MTGTIYFDSTIEPLVLIEAAKTESGIAVVGCQGISEQQASAIRKVGVQLYPMRLLIEDLTSACDGLMELAREWPTFTIVVSGRALDRAFDKNGVPGGLQTRELIYFIDRLKLLKNYASGTVHDVDEHLRKVIEARLSKHG